MSLNSVHLNGLRAVEAVARRGSLQKAAEELGVTLEQVRLVQAGHDAIYGNVAMFVGSLPFHPHDSEPGRETDTVKAGRWLVAKLARELGVNATGGSSSVADAWEPLRWAAATARAQLVNAASLRWKLPADEIEVARGIVSLTPRCKRDPGRRASRRRAGGRRPPSTTRGYRRPRPAPTRRC